MKFYTIIIGIIALCNITQVEAVFCYAQKYVQPQTGNNILLFGDVHVDIEPQASITRIQQHDLLSAAKKNEAFIIAENVQTDEDKFVLKKPEFTVSELVGEFNKLPPTNPLKCLGFTPLERVVERAQKQAVKATDVEFRYHMLGAMLEEYRLQMPWYLQIGYLIKQALRWITSKITGNKVLYPVTVDDYCQVNDTILKEIAAYDDGPILRNFYNDCVAAYHASYITQELRALERQNPRYSLSTIVSPLVEKSGKDRATVLRDFIDHNKNLFDARVAHHINKNCSEKLLFVCTGVDHTSRIGTLLESMGYHCVESYGKGTYQALEQQGIIGKTMVQIKDLEYMVLDLQKVFSVA